MAHDQWIYFMACVFGSVGYLNERLIAYVQHGRNAMGWRGHRTWSKRLRSVFENHTQQYRLYAAATRQRAAILDLIQQQGDSSHRTRAATAAEHFRGLSRLFTERSTLYAAGDIRERARAFRNVLAQGGYRDTWGLGGRSLCKDACLGVLMSPILARPGSG